MLFEVLNRDNVGIMQTDSPSCVYDFDTLKSMHEHGYKFKVNNRITSYTKIADVLKSAT